MLLERLELRAFGPFTDVTLDFGDRPGLHVIQGDNEAGKSSALRAVEGLLFGIAERSQDDHVHQKKDLRIGGRLKLPDGARLDLLRRKGRERTLLDPQEKPLDPAALHAALGGLDRALFQALFGLDHDRLRQGGEDLLAGDGRLGASLFDAARDGLPIAKLVQQLEEEADKLFRPRGQKLPINLAIGEYQDARKQLAMTSLAAHTWKEQREGLAHNLRQRDEARARLQELRATEKRLERELRLLPLLLQHQHLSEQRSALASTPRLSADFVTRRVEQQARVRDTEQVIQGLEREAEQARDRLEQLAVPSRVTTLSDDELRELEAGLARHRHEKVELPRLEAETRSARQRVGRLTAALGLDADDPELEQLRPSPKVAAKLRSLARQRTGVESEERTTRDQRDRLETRQSALRERLAELGPVVDTGRLGLALSAAERTVEQASRRRELRQAIDLQEAEIAHRLGQLTPFEGSAAELRSLPVPLPETVEMRAREASELATRTRLLEDEAVRCREREMALQEELATLDPHRVLPDPAELTKLRRQRDRQLHGLVAQLDEPPTELRRRLEEVAREVHDCDELADRLREQAEQVTRRAMLQAKVASLTQQQVDLERRSEELRAELYVHERNWLAEWEPTGIDPATPEEMRAWVRSWQETCRLLEDHQQRRLELDDLVEQQRTSTRELHACLQELTTCSADASLTELQASARRFLRRADQSEARREHLQDELDALAIELETAARAHDRAVLEGKDWRRAWKKAVRSLGLDAQARPDDVETALEKLRELFEERDRSAELADELERLQDASRSFQQCLTTTLAEHHVGERSHDLDADVVALIENQRRLNREAETRRQTEERLTAIDDELAAARLRMDTAGARMKELLAEAEVEEESLLPQAEDRAREARELDTKLSDLVERIHQHGEGVSLDELREWAAEQDLASLESQLEDLQQVELEAVESEALAASQRVGNIQKQLDSWENQSATAASESAQAALARLQARARRYAELKLSAEILQGEVTRYRERSEGPVLARARSLFPRLTRGRWADLLVGFGRGDDARLLCERANGQRVEVHGLSEGTRDQLYLALRLATLLHRHETLPGLPLLLDDVLINFDDGRSEATLQVLGEVGETIQVLLFTHHARDVELARKAVPADRLHVHDLDALRAQVVSA
ncbi:MAG: AAA family ATPase [Acidobacteriota bacterium]